MVVVSKCNDRLKQPRYGHMAELLRFGYEGELGCKILDWKRGGHLFASEKCNFNHGWTRMNTDFEQRRNQDAKVTSVFGKKRFQDG
jgi:hypothetical protein